MSLPSAPAGSLAPQRAAQTAGLLDVQRTLGATYGAHTWHWMPHHVSGPFDVIAGAILVQHTTWASAERALVALRDAAALDPTALLALPESRVAELVRMSGTPAVKAHRLRAIAETIERAGGLDALLALPQHDLRAALLATHGIGPETADAIALYAAGKPAFVIDAYTTRLFRRLGLGPATNAYAAWQRWFEDALPPDVTLYRDLHAHIVLHAKALCRATPRCAPCPLRPRCPEGLRR